MGGVTTIYDRNDCYATLELVQSGDHPPSIVVSSPIFVASVMLSDESAKALRDALNARYPVEKAVDPAYEKWLEQKQVTA